MGEEMDEKNKEKLTVEPNFIRKKRSMLYLRRQIELF
jgi:hypothetical protein